MMGRLSFLTIKFQDLDRSFINTWRRITSLNGSVRLSKGLFLEDTPLSHKSTGNKSRRANKHWTYYE